MQTSQKKAFTVKVRSLTRTLKQYNNYKQQVDGYDLSVISHDKKQQQFYMESKSALQQVQKNLAEYCLGLAAFIEEHREQIEQDETVQEEYQQAKSQIADVKLLLPAVC